jgi:hypothetical protein
MMCDLVAGSVTFTGPYGAVRELEYGWERLRTVRDMHLEYPRVQGFRELQSNRDFDDPSAPATAKMYHKYGAGAPVAERLQVEMILHQLPILVEPEYHTGLASAGPPFGPNRPTIAIDPHAVGSASTDAAVGSASGGRVAVVDSGDLLGKARMYDFTGGLAREAAADDEIGHGTAVAELIRALSPRADITALRVVNSRNGTSYELLCAMTYALWSEMYDIINVSLSAQNTNQCMTVLGGSLTMVLEICQNNGVALPTVVAAAGNTSTGQAFGYPARLPGSTVVQAWDFNGSPASYNVTVPSSHVPVNATGGDSSHAFGSITNVAGIAEPMYGTSFAAAVATALLIP